LGIVRVAMVVGIVARPAVAMAMNFMTVNYIEIYNRYSKGLEV
jgi:hypothetical protein